jgi:isopentenyl-diphosphate delta-isomerase
LTASASTSQRKLDHVRINLEEPVQSAVSTGLERFRFEHRALPEIDMAEVSAGGSFLGRAIGAPLLISSMTGGAEGLGEINRRLALAAQERRIAMGVGSQRAALEDGSAHGSFRVRDLCPDIPLLANLGAVQLNYGMGIDECRRVVDMIEADALILHLNPLQEAVQPEGDTRWAGLVSKIEAVARALEVPVIAKEVGSGISGEVARWLADAGVWAVDVAGAGGTSWSEVEKHRAASPSARRVAAAFAGWGIPTAESILAVRAAAPELTVLASGGLRDGLDVAKSLALGATLAGLAGPLLRAANDSAERVLEEIDVLTQTLRVAMFAIGARDLEALRSTAALVETTPAVYGRSGTTGRVPGS